MRRTSSSAAFSDACSCNKAGSIAAILNGTMRRGGWDTEPAARRGGVARVRSMANLSVHAMRAATPCPPNFATAVAVSPMAYSAMRSTAQRFLDAPAPGDRVYDTDTAHNMSIAKRLDKRRFAYKAIEQALPRSAAEALPEVDVRDYNTDAAHKATLASAVRQSSLAVCCMRSSVKRFQPHKRMSVSPAHVGPGTYDADPAKVRASASRHAGRFSRSPAARDLLPAAVMPHLGPGTYAPPLTGTDADRSPSPTRPASPSFTISHTTRFGERVPWIHTLDSSARPSAQQMGWGDRGHRFDRSPPRPNLAGVRNVEVDWMHEVDQGPKMSLRKAVASSPQAYSISFRSGTERFGRVIAGHWSAIPSTNEAIGPGTYGKCDGCDGHASGEEVEATRRRAATAGARAQSGGPSVAASKATPQRGKRSARAATQASRAGSAAAGRHR